MNKPNKIDPKVSTISPENQEKRGPEHPSANEKAFTAGDKYTAGSADGYKGLVDGKPKASGLGDLNSTLNNNPAPPQDRTQILLVRLMGLRGDYEGGPSPDDFEPVNVPDLEREILKVVPGQYKNMKPVVQRYTGLKKVIRALKGKAKESLRNHSWQMSSGQIRALRAHYKDLERRLWKCQEQLDLARQFHRWEIQRKEMED